jgi:hypothetical protein
MDKQSKCNNCNMHFPLRSNRPFAFDALPAEEKTWPLPALDHMLKELRYFNLVKCPHCGNQFRTKELRILGLFSPLGFLIFVVVFDLLIVLFGYFQAIKK